MFSTVKKTLLEEIKSGQINRNAKVKKKKEERNTYNVHELEGSKLLRCHYPKICMWHQHSQNSSMLCLLKNIFFKKTN